MQSMRHVRALSTRLRPAARSNVLPGAQRACRSWTCATAVDACLGRADQMGCLGRPPADDDAADCPAAEPGDLLLLLTRQVRGATKPVAHPGKDAASVQPAGRLARRLVCPAVPAAQIKQAVFPRALPGYSGTTLPRANGLAAPVVNSACASKYIADCDRPSGPGGRFLAGTLITKASSIALGSEVAFPWHDFARIDGAWCWAAR